MNKELLKRTIGKYVWKNCEIFFTCESDYTWDFSWIHFLYNAEYNEITYDYTGYDGQFYFGSELFDIIDYKEELPYKEYCDDKIIDTPIYSPKELYDLVVSDTFIVEYNSKYDKKQFYDSFINWYNKFNNSFYVYSEL